MTLLPEAGQQNEVKDDRPFGWLRSNRRLLQQHRPISELSPGPIAA
jgi:hypothetical protein